MSLKASFKDLDILTLSQKIKRLEYWFQQGQEYITDERLNNYDLIKERIKELDPEYNPGIDHIFKIDVDGTRVTGKITRLEKFNIEVEILYPYIKWKNERAMSPGVIRRASPNFFDTWGEWSERILIESYRKLKMIDEHIDNIVKAYNDLNEETHKTEKLDNIDVKKRIVYKLNDWFYHSHIFVSSVTGMIATISDKPQIEKIIKVYKSDKRKIYVP